MNDHVLYKRFCTKHTAFLTFILLIIFASASCFQANKVNLKEEFDSFSIKVDKPGVELYRIINNAPYFNLSFGFDTVNYPNAVLQDPKLGVFFCKTDEKNDGFAAEFAKKISFDNVAGENVRFCPEGAPDGIVKDWREQMDILPNEGYDVWAFVNHNNHTFYSKDSASLKCDLPDELINLINNKFSVSISKADVKNNTEDGNKFTFSLEGKYSESMADELERNNFFVFIKKDSSDTVKLLKEVKEELYTSAVNDDEHAYSLDDVVVIWAKQGLGRDFDIGKTKFHKGEEYDVYFVVRVKGSDGKLMDYYSEVPIAITIPKPDVQIGLTKADMVEFYYDFNKETEYKITFNLEGDVVRKEGLDDPKEGFIIVGSGSNKESVKNEVRNGKLCYESTAQKLEFTYDHTTEKEIKEYSEKVGKYHVYFYIKDGEDVYLSDPREIEFPEVKEVGFGEVRLNWADKDSHYELTLDNDIKQLYNKGKGIEYSGVFVYTEGNVQEIKAAMNGEDLFGEKGNFYTIKENKKSIAKPVILQLQGTKGNLPNYEAILESKSEDISIVPFVASENGSIFVMGLCSATDSSGNALIVIGPGLESSPNPKFNKGDSDEVYYEIKKGKVYFYDGSKFLNAGISAQSFVRAVVQAGLVSILRDNYKEDIKLDANIETQLKKYTYTKFKIISSFYSLIGLSFDFDNKIDALQAIANEQIDKLKSNGEKKE
jgi:hypothetical protein